MNRMVLHSSNRLLISKNDPGLYLSLNKSPIMDHRHLLPDEKVAVTSGNYPIILTNQRIRQHVTISGKTYLTSIFLKNVSSIEVAYKSKPIYLKMGIITLILTIGYIYQMPIYQEVFVPLGIAVGSFLILVYFLSRKHLLSIYAKGGATINFETKGVNKEKVLDFVNDVEREMHKILWTGVTSSH